MRNLVVVYDVRSSVGVSQIENMLHRWNGLRFHPTAWWLWVEKSPRDIYTVLSSYITEQDTLIVFPIQKGEYPAGWHPTAGFRQQMDVERQ